jgi:HEAT repeat protein
MEATPDPENAPSAYIAEAIGNLRVKEAVPTLLHYLNSKSVITALGEIGDERAIEPLRKIAANERGNLDLAFAAKISLIKLESGDPIPQWLDMVKDTKRDRSQRCDALNEIADRPDARSVPALLGVIESDTDGLIVSRCISTLPACRYKTAVLGLIDRLDKNFQGHEYPGKFSIGSNEVFREKIANALEQMTDQDFGTDKNRWKQWWETTGKDLKTLK